MKTIVIPVFLQVTLILINVFGLSIPKSDNEFFKSLIKVNSKREDKYFYWAGVKEMEAIRALKDHKLDRYVYEYKGYSEDNKKAAERITNTLYKNERYYELIDVFNIKHVCLFYGGYDGKGKIFEFEANGTTITPYTLKGGIAELSYSSYDPDEWNWQLLKKYSGQTYMSPDEFQQNILNPHLELGYFNKGTYDFLCNNCHDFLKFCLLLLKDYTIEGTGKNIEIEKDFTFKNQIYLDTGKDDIWYASLEDIKNFEQLKEDLETIFSAECGKKSKRRIYGPHYGSGINDLLHENYGKVCPEHTYRNLESANIESVSISNNNDDIYDYEDTYTVIYNKATCFKTYDNNNSENKKSPWIWIGIGIGIFVLIIIIIICVCCCKR